MYCPQIYKYLFVKVDELTDGRTTKRQTKNKTLEGQRAYIKSKNENFKKSSKPTRLTAYFVFYISLSNGFGFKSKARVKIGSGPFYSGRPFKNSSCQKL